MAELDHVFICTDIGASVAQRLNAFGLVEGSGNVHPGQGSANRRFFFNNLMLELLWVHDLTEASSQPIDLAQRWQHRHTHCPFGVCLRPQKDSEHSALERRQNDRRQHHQPEIEASEGPPFPFWHYRPPYLPSTLSITVAHNTGNLAEPMLFYLAFGQRPDQLPAAKHQPLEHASPLREVTRLALTLPPVQQPSEALQVLLDQHLVSLEAGSGYRMTLGFDGERSGQQMAFTPELPLVLSW